MCIGYILELTYNPLHFKINYFTKTFTNKSNANFMQLV